MLIPVICLLCVVAGALIWRNNHVKMEAQLQAYKAALAQAEAAGFDVVKDSIITAIKNKL